MRAHRVPSVVIRRLAIYLRVLQEMDLEDDRFISSRELGERAGVTAAQVRKDLALFGEFGKQGVGYQAQNLLYELKGILNADREIKVGIVGAGELGTAVSRYSIRRWNTEEDYGFRVVALFDNDPEKIGTDVEGIPIYDVRELAARVKELGIQVMMVAVPAAAAQEVTNLCLEAGIKAILNFAPTKLEAPEDVRIHSTDVTLELQQLAYYL